MTSVLEWGLDPAADSARVALRRGVAITVAWFAIFLGGVVFQSVTRFRILADYKQEGKKFNRYTGEDARMVLADRIFLNHFEWGVPFLVLFWLSLLTADNSVPEVVFGSVYVAARALYPVLVVNGGIKPNGPRTLIIAATVPMYVSLLFFCVRLILFAAGV